MTLFEKIIAGELPASIVHRDDQCIAFMDIHPMSRGHVLVCPQVGVATLDQLDFSQRSHLWEIARRIAQAQRYVLDSQAQHFLVNDGKGASQTVPHVHIHVIPRYKGDRIRTVARIIGHIGVLMVPMGISDKRRAELDDQARRIATELAVINKNDAIETYRIGAG